MQIFMSFYDGQLKQQMCYSFTGSPVSSTESNFPNFGGQNAFLPNSTKKKSHLNALGCKFDLDVKSRSRST